jgi:excisionase family DNA binding protein
MMGSQARHHATVSAMLGSANEISPEVGSVPQRRAYEVPEVARLLAGVSERYVWQLIATGALGSMKMGRRRVVPEEDLDAYVERLREEERQLRAGTRS